jgi:hypothetical protein
MAEECMVKANDLSGLLLLYSSLGKREGILDVATKASAQGKNNIAFMCFFICGRTEACVELLCETGRVPEAAFFARTYAPSLVARVLPKWKQELVGREQPKIADSLADPGACAMQSSRPPAHLLLRSCTLGPVHGLEISRAQLSTQLNSSASRAQRPTPTCSRAGSWRCRPSSCSSRPSPGRPASGPWPPRRKCGHWRWPPPQAASAAVQRMATTAASWTQRRRRRRWR